MRSQSALWKRVMGRHGGACVYCGERATCLDHINPLSYTGDNSEDNLVASCQLCNAIAGSLVFDTFEAKREYVVGELGKPKYANRNSLSFRTDCGQLFRPSWSGSTKFPCKSCYALDEAG